MEIVPVLRRLWRRRPLVLLALMASVAAAMLPGGGSTTAGTATARVLVDTPDSMLTNARVAGSHVSGMRAALFADLMSTARAKEQIARRAGIAPDDLVVRGATAQPPLVIGPLSQRAAIAAADAGATYVLAVTPESRIPIVNLSAYAPDVGRAERLAEAAAATMSALNTVPAGTESGAVVRPLGPAHGSLLVSGGSKKLALIAGVLVFVFSCAGIVLVGGLARWWRGLGDRGAEVLPTPRPPARASAAFAAAIVSSDLRRVGHGLRLGRFRRPRQPS